MRYSPERKEAVLRKMLPPHNRGILELAEEEGISVATLYNWRKAEGRLLPEGDQTPEDWTAAEKFAAVVETAALNEAEWSTWCRERGLYPEQVRSWRRACEQANDWDRQQADCFWAERKADRERLKTLERELMKKKEKALAETAALLVLSKKPRRSGGTERENDQHPGSLRSGRAGRTSHGPWCSAGKGLCAAGDQRPHLSALDPERRHRARPPV